MSNENAVLQIATIYVNFCKAHDGLTFLSAVPSPNDSCIVKIQVDDNVEVTNDENTKEANLKLTKAWSDLVKIPKAVEIARQNEIWVLSVQQVDSNGHLHSVAII